MRESHVEECADSRPHRPRWRANASFPTLGRTGPVHQPALQCLEQAFLSRTHGTPHIQTSAASVPCHVLVSRLHTGLKPRRREHMVRCSPEGREPRQPLHSSSSVRPSTLFLPLSGPGSAAHFLPFFRAVCAHCPGPASCSPVSTPLRGAPTLPPLSTGSRVAPPSRAWSLPWECRRTTVCSQRTRSQLSECGGPTLAFTVDECQRKVTTSS